MANEVGRPQTWDEAVDMLGRAGRKFTDLSPITATIAKYLRSVRSNVQDQLDERPLPAYGSMYQHEEGTTITVSATGTDYLVTGFAEGTPVKGFTFASDQLTASEAGVYFIDFSLTASCGVANQSLEAVLYVNAAESPQSRSEIEAGTANKFVHLSGGDIVRFAVGDTLELRVQNETATSDIDIHQAAVHAHRIGV